MASPTGNDMLAILSWHSSHLHLLLHSLQAYADAVMDEAPLLVLTDHNATVFLRRSKDVKDNRLWASKPVWVDQHFPPARAAWVNGLQQAKKLRCLKQALPRTHVHVPHPLEEHQSQPCQQHTETHQEQAAKESLVAMEQCAAVNHSVALSRKRKSANEQETEEPSVRNRAVRRLMTALDMPRLAASSVTNPAAEETLLLSELGLTDELLAEDQFGDTYMVNLSLQLCIALTFEASVLGLLILSSRKYTGFIADTAQTWSSLAEDPNTNLTYVQLLEHAQLYTLL